MNQACIDNPPLLSYDRADLEWLVILGEESVEQAAMRELDFISQAEFGFVCESDKMNDEEKILLCDIVNYARRRDILFVLIGHTCPSMESVFLGAYNPKTKKVYSPREHQGNDATHQSLALLLRGEK